MTTPKTVDTALSDDTRFQPEPPDVIGNVGQDDAFATESNPGGLRYGEKPHRPGEEHHGSKDVGHAPEHDESVISVGAGIGRADSA